MEHGQVEARIATLLADGWPDMDPLKAKFKYCCRSGAVSICHSHAMDGLAADLIHLG